MKMKWQWFPPPTQNLNISFLTSANSPPKTIPYLASVAVSTSPISPLLSNTASAASHTASLLF